MTSHRIQADETDHEDFLELTGKPPSRHGRRAGDHKTLQLCRQVADTLNYVLSGDCDDELLQNLQVVNVVPAPNSSQLLVTVYPAVPSDTRFDSAEARRRLTRIAGRLRSEVAASITRKHAPRLLFQVIEFS